LIISNGNVGCGVMTSVPVLLVKGGEFILPSHSKLCRCFSQEQLHMSTDVYSFWIGREISTVSLKEVALAASIYR